MATDVRKGLTEEIREAKLYYTAFKRAREAGGLVIDLTNPDGVKTYYEESVSNAERWKIGNDFIAEHEDDEDRKGTPARSLESPPQSDPFWASVKTIPGDAKATYERLMSEQFPIHTDGLGS